MFDTSAVIKLSDKDFQKSGKIVKVVHPKFKGKSGLLAVTASWCHFCAKAAPEIEKLAKMTGSVYPVCYIDADKCKATVNLLGVEGFPTILFIENGIVKETYSGERSSGAMMNAVCDHVKSANFCPKIKK